VALEDNNRRRRLVQVFGAFTGSQQEKALDRIPYSYHGYFCGKVDRIRCEAPACPCPPSAARLMWPISAEGYRVFGKQCLMCDDNTLEKACTTAEGRRRVARLLQLMPIGVQEAALASRLPKAFAQNLRLLSLEGYCEGTKETLGWFTRGGVVREYEQASGSRERIVPKSDGGRRESLALKQCPEVRVDERSTEEPDHTSTPNVHKTGRSGGQGTSAFSTSVDASSCDDTTSSQQSEPISSGSGTKRRKLDLKNNRLSLSTSIVERPKSSPPTKCRIRMTPENIYWHELTLRYIKDQLDEDGAVDDQEFFEDIMHQISLEDRQMFGLPEVIDRAAFSSDGRSEYALLMMAVANAKQSLLEDFVASAERCRWGSMHGDDYEGYGLLKALHAGGYEFEEVHQKISLLLNDVDVKALGDNTGSSPVLFTLQTDFLKSHTDKVGVIALFTRTVSFLENHTLLEPETDWIATYLATLDDNMRRALGGCEYNPKLKQFNTQKNWKADIKKFTMLVFLSYRAHHVHELRAVVDKTS
jgi:hypothetical protein